MSEEVPVQKPLPKSNFTNKMMRPISTGYSFTNQVDPEKTRNIPSEVPKETIKESNSGKLNLNATPFYPKNKQQTEQKDTQIQDSNPLNKNNDAPPSSYNRHYPYPQYQNFGQPQFNPNNNFNNYGYPPPQAYQYPQSTTYFNPQYYNQMNQNFYMMNDNYNYSYNNNKNYQGFNNHKYQQNQTSSTTAPSQNQSSTSLKLGKKSSTKLSSDVKAYIPKSMRDNNKKKEDQQNSDLGDTLNKDAPPYHPQNEAMKKKEEEIQKKKENESKSLNETKKEEENKEGTDKPKEEPIIKKKSKLQELLEKKDDSPQDKTKKSKEKVKNTNSYYKGNKKKQTMDKKINEFNEKDKKIKDEEERNKRKKKEEEEEEERRRESERQEKKRKEEEEKRLKEEEERRIKEEEEKNKCIEKKYFIVFKNKKTEKKEYKYTFEYIMQFKNWKISNEVDLLTEEVKDHIEEFKEEEREKEKEGVKKKKRDDGKHYNSKQSINKVASSSKLNLEQNQTQTPEDNSMEKWARKDLTKEIKAAEEFKKKLEDTNKEDMVKRNLREYLNMLTKDNYKQTKELIFNGIKENVEYQEKFLDVLFQKAVLERAYVSLYAELCKELDKDLPQRSQPKEGKKKANSIMRTKLLDICKIIFQIKNNEKFDEHIKAKDPEEREVKIKKYILGNVYFITELIKIKILSKKIAPVCIKNLFDRYENTKTEENLRLIYLEAIIIFTDQFGTLVSQFQEKNKKSKDSKDENNFKEKIDEIFKKLEKIKDEKNLPGHIKYKIINLIEKRKNNYKKTQYEEFLNAKSRKEVEKEIENKEQITQEVINDRMKKGLEDYKDFYEENGSSNNYPWEETTFLYENKGKSLDAILEGYFDGCGFFIEKESNIQYAKDYIKE